MSAPPIRPYPKGNIQKVIERFVVCPGQAAATIICKRKIMEGRDKASAELGTNFEIEEFHDTTLTSGPMPLTIMEESVGQWVETRRG